MYVYMKTKFDFQRWVKMANFDPISTIHPTKIIAPYIEPPFVTRIGFLDPLRCCPTYLSGIYTNSHLLDYIPINVNLLFLAGCKFNYVPDHRLIDLSKYNKYIRSF